jgi:hypothetical protein
LLYTPDIDPSGVVTSRLAKPGRGDRGVFMRVGNPDPLAALLSQVGHGDPALPPLMPEERALPGATPVPGRGMGWSGPVWLWTRVRPPGRIGVGRVFHECLLLTGMLVG